MVAAAGLCLALVACKEDVYSGLEEREVNEMVAVLSAADIAPSRERDKDGLYALQVEAADVAAAITVLRSAGYPNETFQDLGEVFGAEGVFGTPFEQHARYLHAMNQELSATISAIDGIRSAKVLVTAPARERFDREAPPASAAVTIHHEPGRDMREHLSDIKMIVAHALPNLDYDEVAVALFDAGGPIVRAAPQTADGASATASQSAALMIRSDAASDLWRYVRIDRLLIVLAIVAFGSGLWLWRRRSGQF